ncbi:hypothetical protein PVK06_039207 [Gossypium arboreum]|uniref:Uncharacterized protein n=1 Tax=Gossypium arboreum TaxID=29729 RepID=A0ABR0N2A6_GOSAR|nr:hypothetical protein PVK06_039207 [Gossypium arboreum]
MRIHYPLRLDTYPFRGSSKRYPCGCTNREMTSYGHLVDERMTSCGHQTNRGMGSYGHQADTGMASCGHQANRGWRVMDVGDGKLWTWEKVSCEHQSDKEKSNRGHYVDGRMVSYGCGRRRVVDIRQTGEWRAVEIWGMMNCSSFPSRIAIRTESQDM